MSIEKKSLISNRAATKKANLTKVDAATQVSATKVKGLKVSAAAVRLKNPTVSAHMKVRAL
jgi:hypothetical protein